MNWDIKMVVLTVEWS